VVGRDWKTYLKDVREGMVASALPLKWTRQIIFQVGTTRLTTACHHAWRGRKGRKRRLPTYGRTGKKVL